MQRLSETGALVSICSVEDKYTGDTHPQVIDRVTRCVLRQRMVKFDAKRFYGADNPSQHRQPAAPYEVIGKRQVTVLNAEADPTSQGRDAYC